MNPNYNEFKFPQIKAHPWHKVINSLFLGARLFILNESIICNSVKCVLYLSHKFCQSAHCMLMAMDFFFFFLELIWRKGQMILPCLIGYLWNFISFKGIDNT
jgi:hypothetical protein